jgi:hypothetical protein
MVVTMGLQGRWNRVNLGPDNQLKPDRELSPRSTIRSIKQTSILNQIEKHSLDPVQANWIYKFTSLRSLDNLDSQLLTQNQDCNTLCTAYYLVTFVITVYIARRSPDRSANINPELNSRFIPWEALVLLTI